MKTLYSALLVLLLSSTSFSQITISKLTEITNVKTPRIVGTHTVLEVVDLKSIRFQELIVIDIDTTATIVNVQVNNEKGEDVTPEEVIPKKQYIIANPGTYKVEVLIIDFKKELYSQRKTTLTIAPLVTPNTEEVLKGTALEVQKVTKAFLLRMSRDFETTSTVTASQIAQAKATNGPYPTVTQSSAAHNILDQATRSEYKMELGKIMSPLLGNAVLPETSPQTFKDISIGIKGAVNGR
jgi:hypothetical protein